MKHAIILIGPPGSGKTTITEQLVSDRSVQALETGSLLREQVASETELGKELKPYLDAGELAPTEIVAAVVASGLQELDSSVVLFDGFPRREEELSTFFEQIESSQINLAAVLVLELERSLAVERIVGRGERPEDNRDTVNERLDIYERDTVPVIEYFEAHHPNCIYKESVDQPIPQIMDSIVSGLQQVGISLALTPSNE